MDYQCTNPECGRVCDAEQGDPLVYPCPDCGHAMFLYRNDGTRVRTSKTRPRYPKKVIK